MKVEMSLLGIDGNAHNILGTFQRLARDQGFSQEEIKAVITEATSSDYDHLLQIILKHTVDVEDDD